MHLLKNITLELFSLYSLSSLKGGDYMKRLLFVGILLSNYVNADSIEALTALVEESKATWEATKNTIDNNYSYKVPWASVFGFGSVTRLIVEAGKVYYREYEEWGKDDNRHWIEKGLDVGTHKQGAAAITIDALYDECLNVILKQPEHSATFYVGTFPDGTLQYCSLWPCGAVDDASDGFHINDLEYQGYKESEGLSRELEYEGCLEESAPVIFPSSK